MKSTPPLSGYAEMKNLLRAKRIELGITQSHLSERMGYGKNSVWQWENGHLPSAMALFDWTSSLGFKLEMVPK